MPRIFELGPRGIRPVLEATEAGRIDPDIVSAELESAVGAELAPDLRRILADPKANIVLRDRALAALGRGAAPPDEAELLALIEGHKQKPVDRGLEALAARSAWMLKERDPGKYGEVLGRYEARMRARVGPAEAPSRWPPRSGPGEGGRAGGILVAAAGGGRAMQGVRPFLTAPRLPAARRHPSVVRRHVEQGRCRCGGR